MTASTPAMPQPPKLPVPDPQKVIRKFVSILTKLQGKPLAPARPRRRGNKR